MEKKEKKSEYEEDRRLLKVVEKQTEEIRQIKKDLEDRKKIADKYETAYNKLEEEHKIVVQMYEDRLSKGQKEFEEIEEELLKLNRLREKENSEQAKIALYLADLKEVVRLLSRNLQSGL